MPLENVVETDVLVIGGGMAGCSAAIKAKEKGIDVILVDKGYVSRSGSTPWARAFAAYNPDWGHQLEAWMNDAGIGGEYVNNREWTEIVFKDSYARYQELASWGVEFSKDENGELRRHKPGPLPYPSSCEMIDVVPMKTSQALRNHTIESGVKVMDKIMATDLLKQEGRIVGAIGISIHSYALYIFKAKATVVSTGAAGFKSVAWPICELTGDGEAMAYRAGAEIAGNEFPDTHNTDSDYPGYRQFGRKRTAVGGTRLINAEGNELTIYPGRARSFPIQLEFEVHAGRAPLLWVGDDAVTEANRAMRVVGGASGGMSVHTAEGIWPVNTKCVTSLPGLFAAGDSCGTMQVGGCYSGGGFGLVGAAVTGNRAGLGAAEYTLQAEKPIVDDEEIARLKKVTHMPAERKGGFSPGWVIQALQNTMTPYFIMYIKKEERLQAALTLVEFMRDHLVPKLTAKDPHELRLAHETKSMILNAEIKLRSSLFRTESRGTHYREDYPRRDDPNWLAWIKVKDEQGIMKLTKVPMPKEWWPDLSKPYEERYPVRFAGE